MKTWFNLLTICVLAVGLGACSKKSNKSNAIATTPLTPSLCANGSYYNQQGQLVDSQTGLPCSSTNIPGNSCLNGNYSYNPMTGQYVDNATGQVVNCQTVGGGLPGYNGQQGSGCDYWNQIYYQYGVTYQAVYVSGQLTCVRSDLLGQYIPGYNQNSWYYNQQPMYTCNWGYDPYCNGSSGGYHGSGGCVNFGGSTWGQQFGINGQLGICW